VEVNQIYNIAVSPLQQERVIDPGRTTSFTVLVENKGNGPDNIELSIVHLPEGWDAFFTSVANAETADLTPNVVTVDFSNLLDLTTIEGTINFVPAAAHHREVYIRLAIGQSAWVTLSVYVPITAPQEAHIIEVLGNSIEVDPETLEFTVRQDESTEDNLVKLTVHVINSDLKIVGGIQCPKRMVEGKLVSIRVWVKNIGNIEANNVIVKLYVDGKEVDSKSIGVIFMDHEKLATFEWGAKRGRHTLEVVVDPDNLIVEIDEENNVATRKINVKGRGGLFEPGFEFYCLFAALVVAIGLISIKRMINKEGGEHV
jgi:hypothetical protein